MKKFLVSLKTQPPSRISTCGQNTLVDCTREEDSAERTHAPSFLPEYRACGRIHRAASAGHAARVQRMLSLEQSHVNDTDKNNRTALHYACVYGHPEVVKVLIEWECEMEACDSDNCTALVKASQYQNEQCVEILLEHGANPNAMDKKGYTALHYSVRTENTAIAAKLIKHSASLAARTKAGFTPLLLALNENKQEMAKLLGNKEDNMYANVFINSKKNLKEYEEKLLQNASCRGQEPELELNSENDKTSLDDSNNDQLKKDPIQSLVPLEEREEAEQLVSSESENQSWVSDEEDSLFHNQEAPKINLRKKWKAFKKSRNIQGNSGLPWSDDTDSESGNKEENATESAFGKEETAMCLAGTLVQGKEEAEESPWDSENVTESPPFAGAGTESAATDEATKDMTCDQDLRIENDEGLTCISESKDQASICTDSEPATTWEEDCTENDRVKEYPVKYVNWKEEKTESVTGQNKNGRTCEPDLRNEYDKDPPCDSKSKHHPSICVDNESVTLHEDKLCVGNGSEEDNNFLNKTSLGTEPDLEVKLEGKYLLVDAYIPVSSEAEQKSLDDSEVNQPQAEEKRKEHKTKEDYKLNKMQVSREQPPGGRGDSAAAADEDDDGEEEEEEDSEEDETEDLSDILQIKKGNSNQPKFPTKKNENCDKCGCSPFWHFKVTKESQGKSANTPASEKPTSASSHQVKDQPRSLSKIVLDGGRSQDKSSNKKHKIQKQIQAMEDHGDWPHSSNYDYGGPSNQRGLLCSYEKLIQSKNSQHELLKGENKKMANKTGGIRTEQSETNEMKALLQNRKTELTELRNLRYLLQQEIKKNGNTVHIPENFQSVLRQNKEQISKAVGVERPETSPRTMCMELNDIKNVLKQWQEIKSQHTEVAHSSKKMQNHRQKYILNSIKFKKHLKLSKKKVNENEEFTSYKDLETRELALDITMLRDEVSDFKEKMETMSYKHDHLNENIQCKIQELSAIKNIQKKYEYLYMNQKRIEGEILILTSHIQEKMKQAADQASLKELRDKNIHQRISQLRLTFKDMKSKFSKIKAKNDYDKMEVERHKQAYMEVYTTRKALSNTLIQMKEILEIARRKCQLHETEDKMSV